MAWNTLKKALDLKWVLLDMEGLDDLGALTRWQLFWKLKKGWDIKDYALATANLCIEVLEA